MPWLSALAAKRVGCHTDQECGCARAYFSMDVEKRPVGLHPGCTYARSCTNQLMSLLDGFARTLCARSQPLDILRASFQEHPRSFSSGCELYPGTALAAGFCALAGVRHGRQCYVPAALAKRSMSASQLSSVLVRLVWDLTCFVDFKIGADELTSTLHFLPQLCMSPRKP